MSDIMHSRTRRSSRLVLSIAATALLVLATSATVTASSPNTSTGSGTTPIHYPGDGATRINPDPTVVDLHRQSWDHVTVDQNGTRLVIYFWMGIQDCYGLGKVDVSRHDGQLTVKLWTGTQADAQNTVCPDIAQLYKTVVHLNRPIITGNDFALPL